MKHDERILVLDDLSKYFFRSERSSFGRRTLTIKALNSVTLSVRRGECVALVGESGSGKTTLGKVAIKIYSPTKGKIWFNGKEITNLTSFALKKYRKDMQMVFQDPGSSLNPRKSVLDAIRSPLKNHFKLRKSEALARVKELLDVVEIPETYLHKYPRALSGGQKQRVNIARAISLNPELLVLDEPTSALDVSVQAKILTLLEDLQRTLNLTYVFVTHDLSVAKNISDRIVVMYLGEIVEIAPTEELFLNPLHPYTKALLSAIPVMSADEEALIPSEEPLSGEIPSPSEVREGCGFVTRCPQKLSLCKHKMPWTIQPTPEHEVKCHLFT